MLAKPSQILKACMEDRISPVWQCGHKGRWLSWGVSYGYRVGLLGFSICSMFIVKLIWNFHGFPKEPFLMMFDSSCTPDKKNTHYSYLLSLDWILEGLMVGHTHTICTTHGPAPVQSDCRCCKREPTLAMLRRTRDGQRRTMAVHVSGCRIGIAPLITMSLLVCAGHALTDIV